MSVFSYIKSLIIKIDKETILEDLRITLDSISDIVLPSMIEAANSIKASGGLKSDEVKSKQSDFYKKYDTSTFSKQSLFLLDIVKRLQSIVINFNYIDKLIDDSFEDTVVTQSMSAKKIFLIKACEDLYFISDYCLCLLTYVSTEELSEVDETNSKSNSFLIKKVNVNLSSFTLALNKYGIDNKAFIKNVDLIPEIIINEKTESGVKSMLASSMKTNMKSNFLNEDILSGIPNPIFHLRTIVAEWQAKRYKYNKERKTLLELRLLNLKIKNQKQNDPKLEQEIEYTQSRVDELGMYLSDVEKDLSLKGA